jgi:hypothetical protein
MFTSADDSLGSDRHTEGDQMCDIAANRVCDADARIFGDDATARADGFIEELSFGTNERNAQYST